MKKLIVLIMLVALLPDSKAGVFDSLMGVCRRKLNIIRSQDILNVAEQAGLRRNLISISRKRDSFYTPENLEKLSQFEPRVLDFLNHGSIFEFIYDDQVLFKVVVEINGFKQYQGLEFIGWEVFHRLDFYGPYVENFEVNGREVDLVQSRIIESMYFRVAQQFYEYTGQVVSRPFHGSRIEHRIWNQLRQSNTTDRAEHRHAGSYDIFRAEALDRDH